MGLPETWKLLKTILAFLAPVISVVFFIDWIPTWGRVTSVLAVGLIEGLLYHFGGEKEVQVIVTPPITPIEAKDFLGRLLESLFGWRSPHYRANIMLIDTSKNVLRMWATYNMETATPKEVAFAFKQGQGCSGQAWLRRDIVCLDLTKHTHETYGVNGSDVSPSVKTILSVPIFLPEGPSNVRKILGTLSIDSDYRFRKSRLGNRSIYTEAAHYATEVLGPALRNAS